MPTVLEGLAVVLGADARIRELRNDAASTERKLKDAMEYILKLETLMDEKDVEHPDRPYSID